MSASEVTNEVLLRRGRVAAVVDPSTAALCRVEDSGRPLMAARQPGVAYDDYRGAVCAPWPNRLGGGRYEFAGRWHQLPLNDTAHGAALHGLTEYGWWRIVHRDEFSVELTQDVRTEPGYPFDVEVTARYAVDEHGLQAQITARNLGAESAPYGSCPHPYLVAGPGMADDWRLELPARTRLEVSTATRLPVESVPVPGTPFDFRTSRSLAGAELDHAFTDVAHDAEGWCTARLWSTVGQGVELSWHGSARWVQVYTGDSMNGGPRAAVAIEPMDCPPDAFRSGQDLVHLAPGSTHRLQWRLRAL